jgi:hypothetical protein
MSLRHEFNRIAHLFDGGLEKAEKQAGPYTAGLSRRMREQVDTGRRSVITAEEAIVRHVRENPALYVLAAALLIGVLIARLVLEASREPRVPLL